MFNIEKMTAEMKPEVMAMVKGFYQSDAVDHTVDPDALERTFADAVSAEPSIQGYVLREDENIIGFAYVTVFYACEVGGRCLMFEEIFIKEQARGKGYGTEFIQWIMDSNPDIKRFRLEVTSSNEQAVRLYKSMGFEFLSYEQMIKDFI